MGQGQMKEIDTSGLSASALSETCKNKRRISVKKSEQLLLAIGAVFN